MPVKLKQVQRKSQNTCNHMFISRIKRLNMRLYILKLNRSFPNKIFWKRFKKRTIKYELRRLLVECWNMCSYLSWQPLRQAALMSWRLCLLLQQLPFIEWEGEMYYKFSTLYNNINVFLTDQKGWIFTFGYCEI